MTSQPVVTVNQIRVEHLGMEGSIRRARDQWSVSVYFGAHSRDLPFITVDDHLAPTPEAGQLFAIALIEAATVRAAANQAADEAWREALSAAKETCGVVQDEMRYAHRGVR